MLQRALNRINFLDIRQSKKGNIKGDVKKNIVFIGAFPPSPNGAAAFGYWLIKSFKKRDVNVFICPVGGAIQKKLFPKAFFIRKFADIKKIDFAFFILDVGINKDLLKDVKFPTFLFQTYHNYYDSIDNIISKGRLTTKLILPTKWAFSEAVKKEKKDRLGYIPCGVDVAFFKFKEKQINKEKLVFLFCSRLCFYKGITVFLEAIPLILNEYPDARFIINGRQDESDKQYPYPKGDPYKIYNVVENMLDEVKRKFPNNVQHIENWISSDVLIDLYKKADILIFPSNNEGFGIPIVEAMSSGVIPVVMDKPPMNELVFKDCGYVIKEEDWFEDAGIMLPKKEALFNAVVDIIENKDLANKLRLNGRKKVEAEYDFEKVVDSILNLGE